MERPSFVENGGFKLPMGYRFHPTDEELVVHYLKRKVLGLPMPASVIPEFDVFQNDPSSLPGNLKEKRYFFSQKKLNDLDLGKKCKRTAGSGASGYWKPIGKGKQIVASDSSKAVGTRKTLVFKERKHSIETKSQWVMHGYCLAGSATGPKTTQMEEVGDWVAYSVFQRKRKPRKNVVISNPSNTNETRNVEIISPSFMDFMMEQSSDGVGPPSPCSSGVTEVSSNEVDQEEISSSSISLFSYPCYRNTT